jgi:pimeloyl-ACP methyl ester carboxylesterase
MQIGRNTAMKPIPPSLVLCETILALLLTACSPSPAPTTVPTPGPTATGTPAATAVDLPRVEEVTFKSGTFTLVGDLWLPEGQRAPFPVILFNQGSEMKARINRGFSPETERILRAGYAFFSWDKPGVGKSTGRLSNARLLHERAQILLDAIKVMKARPDIDPKRIGVAGGSQAGYVMPLALSMTQDIAFMICVSCPGMSGADQSTYQPMALALCTGTVEGQAKRRQELLAALDAARTYATYEQYLLYREAIDTLFSTAPQAPEGHGFGIVPEEAWQQNDPEVEAWWNPIEVMKQATIPVLVLLGDQDRQMDPLQAEHAWRKALEASGNAYSRVELFPNANHGLVFSETGCPDADQQWLEEYAKAHGYESLAAAGAAIQENPELMRLFPYAPGYLDLIEEWLRGLRP